VFAFKGKMESLSPLKKVIEWLTVKKVPVMGTEVPVSYWQQPVPGPRKSIFLHRAYLLKICFNIILQTVSVSSRFLSCSLINLQELFSRDSNQIFEYVTNVFYSFLGAFPKLRKALSCLSVCPHGTIRLALDGFRWNFIFQLFSKICREKSSFVKIRQE
jgi:hypothetical protein